MDIGSQLEMINSDYLKNWIDMGQGNPGLINQEVTATEGIENNLPVVGHPDQLYKYYVYSPMPLPNNHIKDEKKNQNIVSIYWVNLIILFLFKLIFFSFHLCSRMFYQWSHSSQFKRARNNS